MSSYKKLQQKIKNQQFSPLSRQTNKYLARESNLSNLSRLDKDFYRKAYHNNTPMTDMALNTSFLTNGISNDFLASKDEFDMRFPSFDLKLFKEHMKTKFNQNFYFDEQYLAYFNYAVTNNIENIFNYQNIQNFDPYQSAQSTQQIQETQYNPLSASSESIASITSTSPNPSPSPSPSMTKSSSTTSVKSLDKTLTSTTSKPPSKISKILNRKPKLTPAPTPPSSPVQTSEISSKPLSHTPPHKPTKSQTYNRPKVVQSLWIGDTLSLLEQLTIRSYLNRDYEFQLYTYNPDTLKNVPSGTTLLDATTILPKSAVFTYNKQSTVDGASDGSPSAFSNMFRYKLLYDKGGIWVDMDLVCINEFNFTSQEYVFASEQDFKTGKQFTASCLIIAPPKSPIMKYCYDISVSTDKTTLKWGQIGPKLLHKAIEKYQLTGYTLPWWDICPLNYDSIDRIYSPNGSKLQDYQNTSHAVHMWGEFTRRNRTDPNNLQLNTLYLELIAKNFKLTGFTTVTEPIKTGYPIIECAKSCLNIMDSFTVIYGRDEKSSRQELEEMGVKCVVTNKWQEEWVYSDMTYHMDLGLKESGGDLCFKIDSDYIMSLNGTTRDEYRERLFQYLPTYYRMYVPKINAMPFNFYLTMQNSIYCINKYLLHKNGIDYEIAVDKDHYVNRLFIGTTKEDEEAKTFVTNDEKLAIFNYDCSEMTKEQFVYKQRGWFTAFLKMGGDISRFGLTPEILGNDDELYEKIMSRFNSRIMWALKKEQLYHKTSDYNPPEIRDRISSLQDTQYGHSHFNDKKLIRTLENYLFTYKKRVVHLE